MVAAKRPTPVRRRLSIVHCLRGRSLPNSSPGSSTNLCSLVWSAACHSSDHLRVSHIPLETSAGVDRRIWWACSEKGRRDFRRAHCGVFMATWWRRWCPLSVALLDNAKTTASRRKVGGAMLAGIGSWLIGVARRQLETVCRVLLSLVSSFLVCELLHQTGAQYLGGGGDQRLGRDVERLGRGAPGCT